MGNDQWIKPTALSVDVRTHDAILNIESVEINPKVVVPGNSAILKVKLKNIADSLLKDINTKLELGNLPVVTSKSGNEKIIKNIDSNKAATVQFDLIAKPDAESNIYSLPIKVSYSDELGNGYIKNIS